MSHNKIFKNLRRDYKKVLGSNYNQNYLDLGTRRCLGTYRVKKKDIISFNVMNSESEVFVDPNNVELIRYDFVNDEQDKLSAIWNVQKDPAIKEQNEKCIYELIRNNDYDTISEDIVDAIDLEQISEFRLLTKLGKEECNG